MKESYGEGLATHTGPRIVRWRSQGENRTGATMHRLLREPRRVVAQRRRGTRPLLQRADAHPGAADLRSSGRPALAPYASASWPATAAHRGADAAANRPLAAACTCLSRLPSTRLGVVRHDGAGCGNSARPDLWRGCSVIRIPTPTITYNGPDGASVTVHDVLTCCPVTSATFRPSLL
jgi:hypothetical protein